MVLNIIAMGRVISLESKQQTDSKDPFLRWLVGLGIVFIILWIILGIFDYKTIAPK